MFKLFGKKTVEPIGVYSKKRMMFVTEEELAREPEMEKEKPLEGNIFHATLVQIFPIGHERQEYHDCWISTANTCGDRLAFYFRVDGTWRYSKFVGQYFIQYD